MQHHSKEKINLFCEYVGKDAKGQRILQAPIHMEIQEHIDLCQENKVKNCGILAPWGHGKTEQLIFRVLKWIGNDPNRRIQYICNTDDNATARVNAVKRYIENDQELHYTFPHLRPAKGQDWGSHKIIVERSSKSKDGTLESWGITTSGTGSRSDIQVFDDPVDLRNAILNPAMREQVKESFRNVWLPRMVAGGFRVYIATAWHEADLTHDLMKNSEWKFLVMRISKDFGRVECESPFKGNYTIPLWDAEWSEERLKKQFKDIGARAFDRGYRQIALNEEDRTFPSSDHIFNWNLDNGIIQPHWPRVTGIDPFGQQVVIFTVAINPHTHQRVRVEIRRGKWSPKETIREIIDVYKTHLPQIMVCENNAAQTAILQWATEVGGVDIPLVPFQTGKQKADPVFGLPGLEVEFANGAWCIPMQGIDSTDTNNPNIVLKDELRAHPIAATWDCVMAMWFAREGARFLINGSEAITEAQPETFTHEDVDPDFEEVVIGGNY